MRGRLLAAVGLAAIAYGGVAQRPETRSADRPRSVTPAGAEPVAARGAGPDLRHQSDDHGPAPVAARHRRRRRSRPRRRPAERLGDRPISIRTSSPATSRPATAARSPSAQRSVSPIYSGGRVRNGVRAADTRVEAGRADLRATEGDIFTEAVAAYMDVIRDRSIVELNRNQVRVLDTNLQATRDRFEVGDLTRTDVAQSDARLALARSSLALAEGRLEASGGELPPRDRPACRPICSRRRRCLRCRKTPTSRWKSRSPTMPISPRSPRGRGRRATTSRSRAAAACRPSPSAAARATSMRSAPPTKSPASRTARCRTARPRSPPASR